jgi:hypothetical protein
MRVDMDETVAMGMDAAFAGREGVEYIATHRDLVKRVEVVVYARAARASTKEQHSRDNTEDDDYDADDRHNGGIVKPGETVKEGKPALLLDLCSLARPYRSPCSSSHSSSQPLSLNQYR